MKKQAFKSIVALVLCFMLVLPVSGAQESSATVVHGDECYSGHIHNDTCNYDFSIAKDDEHAHTQRCEDLNSHESSNLIGTGNIFARHVPTTAPRAIEVLNSSIADSELQTVCAMLDKDDADIAEYFEVYDAQGRPIYLYVKFESGGYAIMLRTDSTPLEYSYTAENGPYDNLGNGVKYYFGMLIHAYEDDGQIRSAQTRDAYSTEQIAMAVEAGDVLLDRVNSRSCKGYESQQGRQSVNDNFDAEVNRFDSGTSQGQITVGDDFFDDAPFAWNFDGDCGPTAAAMLLRYYKETYSLDILPPSVYGNNHIDDDVRNKLQEYSTDGNIAGTFAVDEADKLNVFFGQDHPTIGYHAKWALLDIGCVSNISNGNPVVVYGFFPQIAKTAHAMVAYGYENIVYEDNLGNSTTVRALKVHNGWHESCPGVGLYNTCNGGAREDLWVNGSLIETTLWIEPISQGHSHSFSYATVHYDQGHQLQCSGCNLKKKKEDHTFQAVSINNMDHMMRCTICDYGFVCNGSMSAATCTAGPTCDICGYTQGSPSNHSYTPATCTSPKTCTGCGLTIDSSLGHNYLSATCSSPQTCTRCNAATGSPLGHSYSSATCTSPGMCIRCNATSGSSLGHSYSAATCSSPKTCIRCGVTSGSSLGHNYSSATCISAQKCSRCGTTSGSALGHSYAAATCSSARTCSRCGATSGSALGHSWGATYSEASHPHAYYHTCTRCSTREYTGGHATKAHGNGAWGSGTCPSCGSHSYSAGSCRAQRICSCGRTNGYGNHNMVYQNNMYICSICGYSIAINSI